MSYFFYFTKINDRAECSRYVFLMCIDELKVSIMNMVSKRLSSAQYAKLCYILQLCFLFMENNPI